MRLNQEHDPKLTIAIELIVGIALALLAWYLSAPSSLFGPVTFKPDICIQHVNIEAWDSYEDKLRATYKIKKVGQHTVMAEYSCGLYCREISILSIDGLQRDYINVECPKGLEDSL